MMLALLSFFIDSCKSVYPSEDLQKPSLVIYIALWQHFLKGEIGKLSYFIYERRQRNRKPERLYTNPVKRKPKGKIGNR